MRRIVRLVVFGALAMGAATPLASQGTATKVLVRVLAHDAKLIGSGVGGARVTIRDASNGAVLTQGEHLGGTGNTDLIMIEPSVRGKTMFDTEGAAGFLATLSLERPTMVEVVAEGPLGTPHALQRASKTLLLIPGRDLVGEGVTLELMGFTVVLETPTEGATLRAGEPFTVTAKVTMLFGCPTKPGGLWNADDIEILARLVHDGVQVAEVSLGFAGATSTYTGTIVPQSAGRFELQVLAIAQQTGNSGMTTREVAVR